MNNAVVPWRGRSQKQHWLYTVNFGLTFILTGKPLLSRTAFETLTTVCLCRFPNSFLLHQQHFDNLFFFCLLSPSLCLKRLSVIPPSISPVSLSSSPPLLSSSLSLGSPLFLLLSSLSLLVISTCQAKGSRQMDGQMNTQICRGAKRMMER